MRIIAGKHKGRRIEIGKDTGTIRPTSDFAREAIFNILCHGRFGLNGHTFEGKHVLDVFCGTGAFGLEALSRGAASATFIDQARESIAAAKHNASRMNEEGTVTFLQTDATKLSKARRAYDVVFLDPPYFSKLILPCLNTLREGGWVAEDGLIVVEHDVKETYTLPDAFELVDGRRYGRAVVEIIKIAPAKA
ncbi:MAG: 16S rRNA (guanine(966)-N(2))-methyltransferase RsmD [Alphaproteobacteria bacterium]